MICSSNLSSQYTQPVLAGYYAEWALKQIEGSPKDTYELANLFTVDVANENYCFENSIGFWDLRSRKPSREPDHVSFSWKKGKVTSKYWYTKKGVYRQSDHWGADIASCSWFIKGRWYPNSGIISGLKKTAFIRWDDFKAKGFVGKDYVTGEFFLKGFTFEKCNLKANLKSRF